MKDVYVWEVKTTFTGTKAITTTTYDFNARVITNEKSFAEAEKVGLELLKEINKERNIQGAVKLDEINYIGLATMSAGEGQ